jgi:hypothetical protein
MDASSSGDDAPARAWLAQTGAEMASYLAPTVHTFLPLFLGRADVRARLGQPPADVLAELVGAARCWAANAPLYLHTLPLHRLRSRRLVPLELAVITGDAGAVAALSDTVATDAMSVIAGTEPDALSREIATVAGGPLASPPSDLSGVAGRLALLYWLALAAVVRGERHAFDATRMLAAPWLTDLPAEGAVGRLAALHHALAAVAAHDAAACAAAIATHTRLHDAEAPARQAAAAAGDAPFPGALDLAGLATAQLAAAFGLDVRDCLRALDASPYGPARSGSSPAARDAQRSSTLLAA